MGPKKSAVHARFLASLLLCGLLALSLATAAGEAQPANESYRGYMEPNGCKPKWPEASLRNGESGTVTLAFLVLPDGSVADSKIIRSSGFRGLDAAALVGLFRCQFRPAIENGRPVESWVSMQYRWVIEEPLAK